MSTSNPSNHVLVLSPEQQIQLSAIVSKYLVLAGSHPDLSLMPTHKDFGHAILAHTTDDNTHPLFMVCTQFLLNSMRGELHRAMYVLISYTTADRIPEPFNGLYPDTDDSNFNPSILFAMSVIQAVRKSEGAVKVTELLVQELASKYYSSNLWSEANTSKAMFAQALLRVSPHTTGAVVEAKSSGNYNDLCSLVYDEVEIRLDPKSKERINHNSLIDLMNLFLLAILVEASKKESVSD